MSKSIIINLILIGFSLQVLSQNSNTPIYVKLYGGYGFLSPGSTKGQSSTSPSNDTTFFKVGKKAFGEGIRAGMGLGLILNDYINIGIDAEYLTGSKMKIPITQAYQNVTVNSVTIIKHTVISVIPNITFKAVSKPSYHVYNRIGVIVGIPPKITEDYNYQKDSGRIMVRRKSIKTTYHAEYKLKAAIGYQATIGMQVKIFDNFRLQLEISAYRISFNRIKYEEIEKSRGVVSIANLPPNKSRNIINYSSEGLRSKNIQGAPDAYIFNYTYPQDPININTISSNFGLFLRF